ncbi:ribose 5-phosphate isomerase B [Dongia mobilis]|jgi:ribose 5-phosphate isomerase B|uniref:ribose 5-phosphate isomerase B n=1 Tax=Dongia sp. TaxID=1977262 RepID=UPI0026E966BC
MAEKIAIASDHGGFDLKTQLKQELERLGFEALDLGTDGPASVDYPDFAVKMALALKSGPATRGILICGSGIGISIAANRHPHIRAALCHDHLTAYLARWHNNANVLCLGGRTTGVDVARDCLQVFLGTEFEGGRHQNRVAKLG